MEQLFKSNSSAYAIPGILPKAHVDLSVIIQQVCDFYKISAARLYSKTRKREICEPRQICMFLGRNYLKMTLQQCATTFNKDHATVLHGSRIVTNLYQTNCEFRKNMHSLLTQIGIDQEVLGFKIY